MSFLTVPMFLHVIKYFFDVYLGRWIMWFIFFRVVRSFTVDPLPIKKGTWQDLSNALQWSLFIEFLYFIKEFIWK